MANYFRKHVDNTLGRRLMRLPLLELDAIRDHFDIDISRDDGNVRAYAYSGRLLGGVRGRESELASVLRSAEERLGLKSPQFSPWPIDLEIRSELMPSRLAAHADGTTFEDYQFRITSIDLSGLFVYAGNLDEVLQRTQPIVEDMLLIGWGIDVKKIDEGFSKESGPSFSCLKLTYRWFAEFETAKELELFTVWLTSK